MATKKSAIKPAHSKKELKKEFAGKLESVLAEFKNTLGEKEFQHRIKKATKALAHGLHSATNSNGTPANSKETPAKKIKAVKKAKSAPKETAV